MKNKIIIWKFLTYLFLPMPLFLVTACQADWYPQAGFGSSVNNAIASQIVNKDAPIRVNDEAQGMDGPSAKASIDNYQRSFEQMGSNQMIGSGSSTIINPAGSSSGSNLPSIIGR